MVNIAELLKDCPQGMELDCTMYDKVSLVHVSEGKDYPIKIETPVGQVYISKYGQYHNNKHAKCVIYPKGKTTWEGFVPPCKFKDGDVLTYMYDNKPTIYIYRENGSCNTSYYAGYSFYNERFYETKNGGLSGDRTDLRLATEEEKQKLFKTINDNGYRWNDETKTLEKLFKPKFKVGDRVKSNYNNNHYDIIGLTDTHYTLKEIENKIKYTEPIIEDKNWELIPKKFDITTLKPLESKVLMRSSNAREWVGTIYSHYNNKKFYGCGMYCDQCIPYEGNEHLLGTTDDCDEYYKVW